MSKVRLLVNSLCPFQGLGVVKDLWTNRVRVRVRVSVSV